MNPGKPPMWDERYAAAEYVYGTEPNDFLVTAAPRIPMGRVLSLADGEGRNGVYLATLGYDVTSVDASPVGLGKARRLAAARGVRLTTIEADLAAFEIAAGSWEGIVSIFCHLPAPLRGRIHQQVVRGLSPGGVFILEGYSERQLQYGTGGPPAVELLFTADAVRTEVRGLELLHAGEFEREVHEGTLHRGLSSVVQLIARKPVHGEP